MNEGKTTARYNSLQRKLDNIITLMEWQQNRLMMLDKQEEE